MIHYQLAKSYNLKTQHPDGFSVVYRKNSHSGIKIYRLMSKRLKLLLGFKFGATKVVVTKSNFNQK